MTRGRAQPVTDELLKTICAAIEAGNTRPNAAKAVGMRERWLYQRIEDDAEFAAAIEKADALAEQHHVQVIQTAARKGNWTASAWWLERRNGKDWGRTDRVQMDATISGGLRIVIDTSPDTKAQITDVEAEVRELTDG